jgi:Protein kinase domain/Inner membrane component of T3SS, cytoplasmic domain
MHAYLRVVAGPDQGRVFNLIDGTTLSIGRGEKTDTRLTDGAVGRLHCELRCQGGEFLLTDLESVSGTFIAGQKIEEHALKHGEELQVGSTRLKLYTSAVADTQNLMEAQKSAFHPAIRTEEGILTGQTISRFELGPVLARGSMGTVYKSRDTRAGKDVAVKVLYPEFTHDEASLKRFILVMKTVAGVHHDNLVTLCGAGKHGETCWFAMEYVDGESLNNVIERLGTRKMINWRYTLSMGTQIARALEALHEKHIVHRNVVPENILIRSKDKVPKLADLVLAKVVDGTEVRTAARPGELLGNVAYMAPERTRCDVEVDIRADIYSLGATVYTLLTGRPPFEGKTLSETVTKIRQDDPVPPKKYQDSIPDEFQDVVEKMLAKRPEIRYQDPRQVTRALDRVAKAQARPSDANKTAFIRQPSNPGTPIG